MGQLGNLTKGLLLTLIVFVTIYSCQSSPVRLTRPIPPVIRRLALGRSVVLGQTYDATRDVPLDQIIYKGELEKTDWASFKIPDLHMSVEGAGGMTKDHSREGIDGELAVSDMLGMFEAGADGYYASSAEIGEPSNRTKLVASVRTVLHHLYYRSKGFAKKLDMDALKCTDATHFVYRIVYGGELIGFCDSIENDSIAGKNFFGASGRASGCRNLTVSANFPFTLPSADIYWYSDVYNKMQGLLKVDDVDGHGVPIEIYLVSLELLRDYHNIPTCARGEYVKLIREKVEMITSISDALTNYDNMIKELQLEFGSDYWNEFPRYILGNLKHRLDEVIVEMREVRPRFIDIVRRNRRKGEEMQAGDELLRFRESESQFARIAEVLLNIVRFVDICKPTQLH